MEKFRIILSVLCLGLFGEAGAQEGRLLLFAEPERRVDTVRFDSGAVTLSYPFKNVSGKEVTILEVHSGCGCFTGETDKRVLAPGASALLKASFNPASLHGAQNRHLTVVASDGTDTVLSSVSVSGFVLRDQTEGQIRFPEDLGLGLRTDVSVNALRRDEFYDYVFSIPLYNDSDEPLQLEVSAILRFLERVRNPQQTGPGKGFHPGRQDRLDAPPVPGRRLWLCLVQNGPEKPLRGHFCPSPHHA